MVKDRCDYRTLIAEDLVIEAKHNPSTELCIAIGERLEDMIHDTDEKIREQKERAEDFERDANRLDDKIYELQAEIQKLELMLSQRDDYIKKLEKGSR